MYVSEFEEERFLVYCFLFYCVWQTIEIGQLTKNKIEKKTGEKVKNIYKHGAAIRSGECESQSAKKHSI